MCVRRFFLCEFSGDLQHSGIYIAAFQGGAQVLGGAGGNDNGVNAGLGDHLLNRIGIRLSGHKNWKLGKLLFQERQLMLGQRCFVISQEQDGGQLKGLHIVDIVFFGGALKKALLHTRRLDMAANSRISVSALMEKLILDSQMEHTRSIMISHFLY